jgi:N-formylglutamate amidohydrolase
MESPFEAVLNGRFQGGFITRHYGDPEKNVHAVQLEIAQRVYMDEVSDVTDPSKMARLRGTLRQMLESLIQEAEKLKV